MSWIGSRISRVLPFSPWGFVLLGIAAGVLLLGALRMELASLLWGSSFVVLAVYCLVGCHLSRAALAAHVRSTLEPVDLRLPVEGLFPGAPAEAEVASELPRIAIPGFQVWLAASLEWGDRPPFSLSLQLPAGRQRRVLAFRTPPRGLYRGQTVRLMVRDVLGFTRTEIAVPLAEQLRVFPAVHATEAGIPAAEGGEEMPQRRERRASDELLEVRKYYPGDDLRRVHWKLFAHLQELFLRTGEQTPPPEGRFLAILDLSPSPWVPPEEGSDLLDGLVEACASAVLALLSRGMEAQVAVSDRPRPLQVSLEKAERLLELCSELWWSERLALELPRSGRREVLLYSLPGSARQSQLLRACAARAWPVRLFLKELPALPSPTGSRLRRLFVREAAGEPEPVGGSEGLRAGYERVLEETEGRLRRTRSVHVARV
jgi:uncharacterized protein (DUF58 family)